MDYVTWIIKLCGGLRGFVLACALVCMTGAFWWQSDSLGDARAARDKALTEVGKWKEINQTNADTVKHLERVVSEWSGLYLRAKARLNKLIDEKEQREQRRTRARNTVETNREVLYKENHDVQAWGAQPVPSAVYDGLLDAWRRYEDASR